MKPCDTDEETQGQEDDASLVVLQSSGLSA